MGYFEFDMQSLLYTPTLHSTHLAILSIVIVMVVTSSCVTTFLLFGVEVEVDLVRAYQLVCVVNSV